MKRTLLIAALLALTSCKPAVGDDGYVFERRQIDRPTVSITKEEYSSEAKLVVAARAHGAKIEAQGVTMGFAEVSLATPFCKIHVIRPEADRSGVWWGHETKHCFFGAWHS